MEIRLLTGKGPLKIDSLCSMRILLTLKAIQRMQTFFTCFSSEPSTKTWSKEKSIHILQFTKKTFLKKQTWNDRVNRPQIIYSKYFVNRHEWMLTAVEHRVFIWSHILITKLSASVEVWISMKLHLLVFVSGRTHLSEPGICYQAWRKKDAARGSGGSHHEEDCCSQAHLWQLLPCKQKDLMSPRKHISGKFYKPTKTKKKKRKNLQREIWQQHFISIESWAFQSLDPNM